MIKTTPSTVCIVTPDLLGPVRNGGIGTACTFLAVALADAGHQVSVLFTQCGTLTNPNDKWVARYRSRGIELIVADAWRPLSALKLFPHHPPLAMAHVVHDWLAEHHFDVVFFMEWQGNGFYALQAKRAGLRFQDSVFVTVIHSPSLWHAVNNADFSPEPLTSLTYFMERKSVELADAVVSPSAYMLDWVRRYDFKPPKRAYVLPNLIDVAGAPPARRAQASMQVDELVFFGRLEYRKGLVQFCEALDRLASLGVAPNKVAFLGKFSRMGQDHSGVYIARRATKWPFPIEIHARLDQAQALAYLRGPGRLAVMPSVADNSPYTVYECLVAGVPFLARNVGGVAELIAPPDRASCLFDDNPRSLAERFALVLREGAPLPRLAFDLDTNRQAWRAFVDKLATKPKPARRRKVATPKVSVCLTHYNRPKLLKQAVDSLLAQDYPNFEVVLVDDGSPGKAAQALLIKLEPVFSERGWRIVRQPNGYLGKARNNAVRHAKGEFVLFMDDDNVAKPGMISRFVQAAVSSGADLVTAMFDVFTGERPPTARTPVVERFLPVGDIVSFSVVTNAIGDANALMRRSVFKRLGGFSEDYGLGHEDFELYLRAVLASAKVCVVPESLFWYRRNGTSMLSDTNAAANRMRSFRPFLDALPAPLAEMAVLAHSMVPSHIAPTPISPEARALSHEDQRRLQQDDPDAPATVAVLAKVLNDGGQTQLAQQLLDDLNATSGIEAAAPEMAVARLSIAAQRGDLQAVKTELKTFGRSRSGRELAANACDFALASIGSSSNNWPVISLLIETLIQGKPQSISTQLIAAEIFSRYKKFDTAITFYERGLHLANAAYLKNRPDVAAAVGRKDFSSGLQHYVRHGQHEGFPWPEQIAFIKAGRVFSKLKIGKKDFAGISIKPECLEAIKTFRDNSAINILQKL